MKPHYLERIKALNCLVPSRFALVPGNLMEAASTDDLAYDGSYLLELRRLWRKDGLVETPMEQTASSFPFQVHRNPPATLRCTLFIDGLWGREHLKEMASLLATTVGHIRQMQARAQMTNQPGGALFVVLVAGAEENVVEFLWECGDDPQSEILRTVTSQVNHLDMRTQSYEDFPSKPPGPCK